MGRTLFLHDDARILDGIRSGKEEVLDSLYRSSRRQVIALVVRNGGTEEDAQDVLQDALIVLWERVRAGRFTYEARLETFIYAVARNIWLRRLSRRSRERPLTQAIEETAADPGDALEELIDEEQAERVRHAMKELGEPCRTILLLFYWEEKSMEEIAAAVGLANAETAKARKYQCKKALEQLMHASDGTPGRS